MTVDYQRRVTIPIRDMHRDGLVVFLVDVYGLAPRDMMIIPGGSDPARRAVDRLGLDPNRYQASIWDLVKGD